MLQPWQASIIANLFGWKRPDGTRRYREALLYVPKKNGKTPLAAGIALYMLLLDNEPGAQIIGAAADRAQAGLVFRHAAGMVRADERLKKAVRVYIRSIVRHDKISAYLVVSADAYTKHGYNAHAAIIDELHAQPNRDLVDCLRTATASRLQPLTLYITTADFNRPSICNEVHGHAIRVRDGGVEDPAFLPIIFEAAKTADWKDPAIWAASNPNLGVSVQMDYIMRACKEAQENFAYENTFKRLHLNMQTEQIELWMDMKRWDACGGAIDREGLKGIECYAGLDLGATSDLTSLCLLFPCNDGYRAIWYHWCPRDVAAERDRKTRIPYMTWARDGWLELTDGDEIDYSFIRKRVNEIGQEWRIKELAADRLFQGAQLCQDLSNDGFDVVPFGQGFLSMTAPSVAFANAVGRGELKHGDNPILKWMAGNVAVKMDAAGNIKPDKSKSGNKIDGIVAAIMALGRAMARGQSVSVYETRGIEFL